MHGDVLHSKPAIVNYNRTGQPANRDIWVFYGANDGVLHAVKGGQDNADGYEEWGFVAPEFFDRFARLYKNSPAITQRQRQETLLLRRPDVGLDLRRQRRRHQWTPATSVILFASARRGGRLLYAFDITDPTSADVPVEDHEAAAPDSANSGLHLRRSPRGQGARADQPGRADLGRLRPGRQRRDPPRHRDDGARRVHGRCDHRRPDLSCVRGRRDAAPAP